jgi:hypothetical protein
MLNENSLRFWQNRKDANRMRFVFFEWRGAKEPRHFCFLNL